MRSALCMYGKIGGLSGKDGMGKAVDFRACFESLKNRIIDVNNCDTFMHCWNPEFEAELLDLYRPMRHLIELQINFETTQKTPTMRRDEFIGRSRWYSTKKVLELKAIYEKKHKFTYDWVMLCRYDVMFFVDLNFAELEPGFLYVSHFNDWGYKGRKPNRENHTLKNNRYLDMWLIGPSAVMDSFGFVYDHFYQYSITDPHMTIWQHLKTIVDEPMNITRFKFYRWYDYEIYRIVKGAQR